MPNHKGKSKRTSLQQELIRLLSYPFNLIRQLGINTRFSIAYRIAASNLRLLLQYALAVFFATVLALTIYAANTLPFAAYRELQPAAHRLDIDKLDAFVQKYGGALVVASPRTVLLYQNDEFGLFERAPVWPGVIQKDTRTYLILPSRVDDQDKTVYTGFAADVSEPLGYLIFTFRVLGIALLAMVILIFFRSAKTARRWLSPLREMSEVIKKISDSDMTSRINVTDTKDELKDIAQSFNRMMDHFETAYEKQKQFVSDASHELRTPIAVVAGYANMLNRWGKKDPKIMQESIDAILEETEHMNDLVQKLLFIARSDKASMQLEKTRFHVVPLVKDLAKEFALIANDKHFSFNYSQTAWVVADKNRIKEALRIIIDNAVKFTPGGGAIKLSVYSEPSLVCISVADNGPGIPKDELPRIFDRFFSKARSQQTDQKEKSHGLGLALAKIIVLAHKGKLTVRSKPGTGTEFIVKLPSEVV